MEIGFGVQVPRTGARADVVVRAPDGTCLGEVADQLLGCVLPASSTGSLSVGGAVLPPSALLGQPPLLQGALLQVAAPESGRSVPELCELRVVGGPDAGRVHLLPPGEVVLGRDPSAGIPLADADVSRAHCRLRISHDGVTVTDLGSTNGTSVDDLPVGPQAVPLPPEALLRVGQSLLTVTSPSRSSVRDGAVTGGRIALSRPPRLLAQTPRPKVLVPFPPVERERDPLPLLGILAPPLLGIGMWRLTGSTTFLLLTLLSPLMVVGQLVTERRTGSRRSRRERARWREQRDVAERALAAAVRADERVRRQEWPDPAQTLVFALSRHHRLWERRRTDEMALQLRLGLADQPARVDAEGDVEPEAALARDVPLVVPLAEVGVLGLAGPGARSLGRWVLAQAAAWHGPRDLQVVVLAEPGAATEWEWPRWLPHTQPDEGQQCAALLGLTPTQAASRVRELTALVASRREAPHERGPLRPVLVLIDGARALRAVPGLPDLLSDGPAAGVLAVCVDQDERLLPEQCTAIAHVTRSARIALQCKGLTEPLQGTADLVHLPWAETLARALAPLDDRTPGGAGTDDLPSRLRWTDVARLPLAGGADDVDQVAERWRTDGRCTRALLGRGPHGDVAVDLAQDGPHALVAGTTGSGKSELLQTLVASLALGNRPDELTFVLVDYKGGAAFGPCAGLPHTVGLVTDLDGALVERALSSLSAELSRREALLAAQGAKDVEDHRRRVTAAGQHLPRLVIVVDEFATLAEELPDFVRGLVGIAMRGRSLGVHLVLATQRPEGVVSADIRANTNLRLCLAVTHDSESRDVLDSPLAARIPRSAPGRGYLRTGHDELLPFQTARIGGPRPSADTGDLAPVVEVLPGLHVGDPPAPRRTVEDADDLSDLSLLVAACSGAAARLHIVPPRSPWLPPLPPQLVLDQLPPVDDPDPDQPGRVPAASYGLMDLPAEQAQRALQLDLDHATHLRVVGAPRAGRTTVLRTIAGSVAAVASPDDVHLYALDLAGGLASLTALPHTGAVIGRDQPQRLDRLLTWLLAEVTGRQAELSAGGHAGIVEQRRAVPEQDRLPHLLLLIDGWEAFLAAFQDVDAGRLVDLVHTLLREGPAAGLHVVLTTDRSGLLGRIASLVDETLVLRLADRGDYVAAGLRSSQVPADLPPGRGWSVRHEAIAVQVALLDAEPTGPAQAAALAAIGQRAGPPRWHRPRRVEPLPATVRRPDLPPAAGGRGCVVLGVGGDALEPVEVDLDDVLPGFLVAGPAGSGRSTVLVSVAEQLVAAGLPVVAVAPRRSPLREVPGLLSCVTDEAGALPAEPPGAVLVDDAELLVDTGMGDVLERAVRTSRDTGVIVVAAGSTEELLTGYRGFVVELRRSRTGLLLSPQAAGDGDLLGVRLPRSALGKPQAGRGLLVRRGTTLPLQVALPG